MAAVHSKTAFQTRKQPSNRPHRPYPSFTSAMVSDAAKRRGINIKLINPRPRQRLLLSNLDEPIQHHPTAPEHGMLMPLLMMMKRRRPDDDDEEDEEHSEGSGSERQQRRKRQSQPGMVKGILQAVTQTVSAVSRSPVIPFSFASP